MNTHPQHPENMSNEDIIAMACRIREDENAQLHVRPWKSRSRIAWYVAIPAACLVSFFLGYLLRPDSTGIDCPDHHRHRLCTRGGARHHLSDHQPSPARASTSPHRIHLICIPRGQKDRHLCARGQHPLRPAGRKS